jgi:hypothetical protein
MLDDTRALEIESADTVEFLAAGTAVVGAFHCADCGYGITLRSVLPSCPMCSGTTWEAAPWSPFRRAGAGTAPVSS